MLNCNQCNIELNDDNTPKCIICEELTNDNDNNYCRDINCSVRCNSSIVRDFSEYVKDSKGIFLFMCNPCFKVFNSDQVDDYTKNYVINKIVCDMIDSEDISIEEEDEITCEHDLIFKDDIKKWSCVICSRKEYDYDLDGPQILTVNCHCKKSKNEMCNLCN
jgi:hypothetical protein